MLWDAVENAWKQNYFMRFNPMAFTKTIAAFQKVTPRSLMKVYLLICLLYQLWIR
jgi:hypothetical protein